VSAELHQWSCLSEAACPPRVLPAPQLRHALNSLSSSRARRLAAAALAIEAQDARSAGCLGFMARIFIQATLPHSRPRSHEFERVNGHFSLQMHAPPSVGLPYGSYPRLVLCWLATEAVRTRSRTLQLGPSLSAFMHQLSLTPVTGRRGTKLRLADQLHRLFSTPVRWTDRSEDEPARLSGTGYSLAHRHDLWWSPQDPDQHPLWSSTVTLGADFFAEILHHPVPVDLRALAALRGSPLALDIYTWLTYRLSYLRRPCLIPWPGLESQFGGAYGRHRDFRRRFLSRLASVLCLYPRARCTETRAGLLLKSSPPHVDRH